MDEIISLGADIDKNEFDNPKEMFSNFMSMFYNNEQVKNFIFHGLDSLPVSICIYDKNARLIYANLEFCDYIQIKDRESVYGMHIDDMLQNMGVRISSIKRPYNPLRMKDVLKTGKSIVNWEVEVEYTKISKKNILASNDMYPFFGKGGKVIGMVEIARLRNKQIKEVGTALGLVADYTFDDIIGKSKLMIETKKLAKTFAGSPYNVLIYGESGVGKELFAQSIHNYSDRKNSPFVAINCASIPPELIDSELFGYEGGAFTGAAKSGRIGRFELANGGTLFLDEVAELPLYFQTRLLRSLETNQIIRVGGSKNISVDVRVIAATNRALEKMVEEGLFRQDLYYRLMVLNIKIPSLRDHPEDIPLYGEFFLQQSIRKNNLEKKTLSEDAKNLMMECDWPGNIRELRNMMNRISILSKSAVITREIIENSLQPTNYSVNTYSIKTPDTPDMRLKEKKNAIQRSHADLIKEALSITNGNKKKAAELLSISRKTLYRMIDRYKPFF